MYCHRQYLVLLRLAATSHPMYNITFMCAGAADGAPPFSTAGLLSCIPPALCAYRPDAATLHLTASVKSYVPCQVRLTVHRRSVRLAYLPAYHLHYVHGEKYTPSRADIVPAEYDAVVGGAACGKVVAELHPSPVKSQVCELHCSHTAQQTYSTAQEQFRRYSLGGEGQSIEPGYECLHESSV